MAAPYSDDLRQKAVSAVERGEKKSHVCRTLNIIRNTLDIWLKRKKQTGTVAAKTNYRRGTKPKFDDLEAFQKLGEQYGHLTQEKKAQNGLTQSVGWELVKPSKELDLLEKNKKKQKKTYGYRERDEEARKANWRTQVGQNLTRQGLPKRKISE